MYSNLDPAVNGSMPAVCFVVAGEDQTKRQKDLAEAAQERAAAREKLFTRHQKLFISSDLWRMLRTFYPLLFLGVGKTWRTTTDATRARLYFVQDMIYGRSACRRHKGYMRMQGLSYLSPLLSEPSPAAALAKIAGELEVAGLKLDVKDYEQPMFGQHGWCRSGALSWNEALVAEIKLFREKLKRGVIDQPVRIDSPTGKPRKTLPVEKVQKLLDQVDAQIAACKNPVRKRRMQAYRPLPSFKAQIAEPAKAAIAQALADKDLKSAATIAKVAAVGRSLVGGRPDSESTRVGSLSSPGNIKARYRRMVFPDAVELDMVACNLHNASMIADAPRARELLQGWAAAGLDPYMMIASEALVAAGVPVPTQLRQPTMLLAARKLVKKTLTPLLGGAKPNLYPAAPLEYPVGSTKRQVAGFVEQVLAHPVADIPVALFGADGSGGLARELITHGKVTVANGTELRVTIDPQDTLQTAEKKARKAIYLALDHIEGVGIVAGQDFLRDKCAGKLRLYFDLSDGFAIKRIGQKKTNFALIEKVCRAMEEGMKEAGGFGRCKVSFDAMREGEQSDEVTIKWLQQGLPFNFN